MQIQSGIFNTAQHWPNFTSDAIDDTVTSKGAQEDQH